MRELIQNKRGFVMVKRMSRQKMMNNWRSKMNSVSNKRGGKDKKRADGKTWGPRDGKSKRPDKGDGDRKTKGPRRSDSKGRK